MAEMLLREVDNPEVFEMARSYYGHLAYHNFDGHILSVLEEGAKRADELEAKGVKIDREVVGHAALLHDAAFEQDYRAFGYNTKEALSKDIAVAEHRGLKILTDEQISNMAHCIDSTHFQGVAETNEAKLMRMIDVGNVYGSLWEFAFNGLLLARESIQRGLPLPETYETYCQTTSGFLEFYFGKPLEFTAEDGSVVTLEAHYLNARRNINLLARIGRVPLSLIGRFVPDVSNLAPESWLRK